ncbi:enoyl-[acyl-carrier-protein] reductase [bacterium]|nr:enoyl-[acyl-carrier-protein] reductase [bacterium]
MKNLHGKKAFIAGIADDRGYGWAIAKALAEQGCQIIIGTWVPLFDIFKKSLDNGKLDTNLDNGEMLKIAKIYPLDASFDTMDEVPASVLENKRYREKKDFAIADVARLVEQDFGNIDFLIHSLANAPEIKKPLSETSRQGYLDAVSNSSYSFVSLAAHFANNMHAGGTILNLSYLAAQRAIPGYGGGMSSAKAALESDTKTLAYELGRKFELRVNSISAGPLSSRAATAIGGIDAMIEFSETHAPLVHPLSAADVGKTAAFLCSDGAKSITGSTIFVDNGLHIMGPCPAREEEVKCPPRKDHESLLHPAPL